MDRGLPSTARDQQGSSSHDRERGQPGQLVPCDLPIYPVPAKYSLRTSRTGRTGRYGRTGRTGGGESDPLARGWELDPMTMPRPKRPARRRARTTRKGAQFGGAPGTSLRRPAPPSGGQTGHFVPLPRRQWLDYDTCAVIAGVSPHTVIRACAQGVLPYRIVTWRRRNWVRHKRLIADVDLLNWIYLRPHPLPRRRTWSEPDAGGPEFTGEG